MLESALKTEISNSSFVLQAFTNSTIKKILSDRDQKKCLNISVKAKLSVEYFLLSVLKIRELEEK